MSNSKDSNQEDALNNEMKDEKVILKDEERLQLEEQIRKFVQLVTQSFLLSCEKNCAELNLINESSKQILIQLGDIATQNKIFKAHNLTGAIDIVTDYELSKIHKKRSIAYAIKNIIFTSEVFMYPELLPSCTFFNQRKHSAFPFCHAEDNLLALGLERFSPNRLSCIQSHLLPCKTERQLRHRIKNLRASRAPKDNPIKYYYTHKKAPPMPRNVQLFDPNKIRAPKDNPTSIWSRKNFPGSSLPKIIPKSVETVYKPLLILPTGLIIQGDVIKSCKNVYKPPFILPKGTMRNDKEPNSVVTNQLDMEDNKKNYGNCISKTNNLTMPVHKEQDRVSVEPFALNEKNKQKNNVKHAVKENDALDETLSSRLSETPNKTSENILKKKQKNPKILDKVNKNYKNKSNSKSSTNLNKYCKVPTREQSCNMNNSVIDSKKRKISKTVDYVPDPKEKDCGVIIKSEIVEENSDLLQDACSRNCEATTILAAGSHEQNSNVIGNEIENKNISNALSETTKLILPHVCHIKEEPKDDIEIEQTCESAFDVNASKCDDFVEPMVKKYENINHIKYTNQQTSKSVDFLPSSNGQICGIIIKSEIVEEGDNLLADINDFDKEKALFIDSFSNTKYYNTISNNSNLTSVSQPNITKKRHLMNDSNTITKFHKRFQNEKQCHSYMGQKCKRDEITNILTDINQHSSKIYIKTENIDNSKTLLQNTNDTMFNKSILRTRNIIKSNSLEKAHLKASSKEISEKSSSRKKRCNKKVSQKRTNQKFKSKKVIKKKVK